MQVQVSGFIWHEQIVFHMQRMKNPNLESWALLRKTVLGFSVLGKPSTHNNKNLTT